MGFSLTLSHVGIYVTDMARMVDFYTRFLGFAVSDRGPRPGGEIVFMTRDPREHHQFVLASGRPADVSFNVVNQLSFRVDSLGTLRELYKGLKDEDVEDLGPVTHGNALSIYFLDPEKNRVEVLVDTPWYVPQPHRLEIDLLAPDEEIWKSVETHVRETPGFKPRSVWVGEIEQRIAEASARRAATLTHGA